MKKHINHGVIWKNKDKNGNIYLAFKAERDIKAGESFNLFSNNKGGVETRPDFKAYDVEEVEDSQGRDAHVDTTSDQTIPF